MSSLLESAHHCACHSIMYTEHACTWVRLASGTMAAAAACSCCPVTEFRSVQQDLGSAGGDVCADRDITSFIVYYYDFGTGACMLASEEGPDGAVSCRQVARSFSEQLVQLMVQQVHRCNLLSCVVHMAHQALPADALLD